MKFEICFNYIALCTSIVSATYDYLDGIEIKLKSFNSSKLLNLTNGFNGEELNDMTIKNSYFPKFTRHMFEPFKNLHTLTLDDTRTEEFEDDTFHDLQKLTNLYITNNKLTSFKSTMVNSRNLIWLDISNNSLTSLADFNISAIPSLSVLNISNNLLEFLPKDILDKVKSYNRFFIIVDNNPWNCSDPLWKDNLQSEDILAFCSITSVDNNYAEVEEQNLVDQTNTTNETSSKCLDNTLKTHCPFWIFGALWCGIILGNVRKLKQLVFCPKDVTLEDKATQCDQSDMICISKIHPRLSEN